MLRETYLRIYDKLLIQMVRQNKSYYEGIIWQELKDKKMFNYEFYQKYNCNSYIIDFYCIPLKLAIELVEGCDNEELFYVNYIRKTRLEKMGLSVIHINRADVLYNPWTVIEHIKNTIELLHNLKGSINYH